MNSEQNDTCFKYHGTYVDFVHSDVDGLWSVFFDNKRVKSGLLSKRLCYKWFTVHQNYLLSGKINEVE